MNNIGTEKSTPPNGYREPSSFEQSYRDQSAREPSPRETVRQSEGFSEETGVSTARAQRSTDQGEGMRLGQIVNFARDVQAKVKEIPYIVPIAAGSAGFVLGVLASSRILRQLVFIAGGYAVKEAVKSAPKDEMLAFAKKLVVDAIQRQSA